MNVTIDAPAGYEYQYLASVYLILIFIQKKSLQSAVIDSLNKEDLHLTVKLDNGDVETIEVQFKKKKGVLTIDQFAAYFTHFNAYSDNVNVLSKLSDGTADKYYLVCSSRANDYADDLGILAEATTLTKYGSNSPTKATLKQFADAIKLQHKKKSNNPTKRNTFVVKQANNLLKDYTLYQTILQRSYILEKLDDITLKKAIGTLLSDLHIPVTKEEILISRLVELVRQARGTNQNIIHNFNNLVQQTASNLPSVVSDYVARDLEDPLLEQLKERGVLLLTGATMCGKTQLAQSVIGRLVQSDSRIIYSSTTDIERARLVLTEQANESRVCYLEDPIDFNSGNRFSDLRKIEALIQQLPVLKGRYLVVTLPSRSLLDQELELLNTDHSWNDLTVTDRRFLNNIWNHIKQSYPGITDKVDRIVKKAIERDHPTDLLQPGQLNYLGRNIKLLRSETEVSVKLLANVGAKEIEQQILLSKDPDIIDAALLLGLTTSTLVGPQSTDLQYLSGKESNGQPGLVKEEVGSISSSLFSDRPAKIYKLNTYGQLDPIPSSLARGLEHLADSGYLHYVFKEPRFVHPIFQDGARRLLSTAIPNRFERIIAYAHKSASSLNAQVAANTILCLDLLYDQHDQRPENQKEILTIAEAGLKSTFVNVRNLSLMFLIGRYRHLGKEQQNEILQIIIHRSFGENTVYWQNGQAFIPDTNDIDKTGARSYGSRKARQKAWNSYVKKTYILNSEDALKMLKDAYKLTRYNKARISFPLSPLLIFLNYEESFIRERAAFLIAASVTENDIEVVKELFNDSSPFVKYQLVRGLFRSWPYLNQSHKDEMLQMMKKSFDNPFSALSAIDLFTQFNAGHTSYTFDWREDVEDQAAPDMWFLWSELMVIFFKHLPYEIFIHKDRFLDALLNAQINEDQKWKIVQSWLIWLPGHLNASSPINISGQLIDFLESFFHSIDPAKRLLLTKQLLSFDNLDFKLSSLRLIIHFWNYLSSEERKYLEDFAAKADHFVQSVILTAKKVPDDLQIPILGSANILGKPPERICNELTPKRLIECLNILFINTNTDDLTYNGKEQWKKTLPYLIQYPEKAGFEIAFYVMLTTVELDRGDKELWKEHENIFRTTLERQDDRITTLAFHFLLEGLTGNMYSHTKALWHIFFEVVSVEKREIYGKVITENIESITYHKNLRMLPDEIIATYIESEIGNYWTIIEMFTKSDFDLAPEGKTTFAYTINAFIKVGALRTWPMYSKCRDWARDNKKLFSEEEFQKLEDFSEKFFQTERTQRSAVENQNLNYFKSM